MNRRERRKRVQQQARDAANLTRQAGGQGPARVLEASQKLFQLGRIVEALPALQKAVAEHPGNAPLRASLAYALGGTGAFAAAADQYRRLLKDDPQSVALRTNLAVLLLRTGGADEARELLTEASRIDPEHANTAFTLGELWEQQKRRDQAFHHYRRAAMLYSRQIGANPSVARCNDLVKLASAQMWTGDIDGALNSFARALALRPDHALALARRGLLLAKLRRMPEAIASLKRAAAVEPGYAEVRRAIGDMLLNAGRSRAAESQFRAALRINPLDSVAAYFLAASKSQSPDAPPPEYVTQLFDDYAERFEKHLVGILQYRAPELLCEAIARVANPPAAAWDVIDLGCGTGLCGPLIRPFSARLTGVDLSAAMLEKARGKSVYDELVEGDVSAVLGGYDGTIDLALAADVLVYIGNLAPVFAAAERALRPGAWFGFTTESQDGDGFSLDTTGRYRHSRSYVAAEAAAHGFTVVDCEAIVARYQSRKPVMSDLYIMQRGG